MHARTHTYTLTKMHRSSLESLVKALKWSRQQSPTALWVTSTQILAELYAETLTGPLYFPLLSLEGLESNTEWPVGRYIPVIYNRPWQTVRETENWTCVYAMIMYNDVTITHKNQLSADLCKQIHAGAQVHLNYLHMLIMILCWVVRPMSTKFWRVNTEILLLCTKTWPGNCMHISIWVCIKLSFGCRAVSMWLIIKGWTCDMKCSRDTDTKHCSACLHEFKYACCTLSHNPVKLFDNWDKNVNSSMGMWPNAQLSLMFHNKPCSSSRLQVM